MTGKSEQRPGLQILGGFNLIPMLFDIVKQPGLTMHDDISLVEQFNTKMQKNKPNKLTES